MCQGFAKIAEQVPKELAGELEARLAECLANANKFLSSTEAMNIFSGCLIA